MSNLILTAGTTALPATTFALTLFPRSHSGAPPQDPGIDEASMPMVTYGTEEIDDLDIFFREAGDPKNPKLVLLHGFPTSSHMFRDLIPNLAEDFHIIAPDYPGYGMSSAPSVDEYDYTFDNLAGVVDDLLERRGFDKYALYLMDYGAPVGFPHRHRPPRAHHRARRSERQRVRRRPQGLLGSD